MRRSNIRSQTASVPLALVRLSRHQNTEKPRRYPVWRGLSLVWSRLESRPAFVFVLLPGNRDRREQAQVNRRAHRQVADPVRMDLVARRSSRAFGDKFGAHPAGPRIERRGIEIGNPVEQTTLADELVKRLALGVFLGRAV